ncbi:MAG: hypothetical protein HN976_07990, partial [Lentisphaerae bacterium]|nr:hypothetical protein [Lentisphaerota bacterium]
PVWGYFDDVVVTGAELRNGGFEEINAKGLPAGWYIYTPSHSDMLPILVKGEKSAHAGTHCVKLWYNGAFSHKLQVRKGQTVTVKAKVRGESGR